MRVLITGADGFIGSHLRRGLRASGWQLYGLCRSRQVGLFRCDLRRGPEVLALLRRLRPQAVVHAAGSLRGDGARAGYRNNVDSTRNLAAAAAACGVRRLVFLSSNSVYGDSYDIRLGQEARSGPRDWYARSKLACERLLRRGAARLPVVILRLPAVLGPGKGSEDLVAGLLADLRRRGCAVIRGEGASRRQFLDVRDLVPLVRHCLRRRSASSCLLGTAVQEPHRIREIGELAVRYAGRGRLVFDRRRRDAPDQHVDPRIAAARLGLGPRLTLEDSLRALVRPRTS